MVKSGPLFSISALKLTSKSDGFVIVGENHFIGATVGVECSRFIVLLQPFDDVSGKRQPLKKLSTSHGTNQLSTTKFLETFTALKHSR